MKKTKKDKYAPTAKMNTSKGYSKSKRVAFHRKIGKRP